MLLCWRDTEGTHSRYLTIRYNGYYGDRSYYGKRYHQAIPGSDAVVWTAN